MNLRKSSLSTALAVLPFVLCFGAAGAASAEGGTFNRTLQVTGAPTVTIATGSGYIHVSAGSNSEIRIEAKVSTENSWGFSHSGDNDRVHQLLANPPIVQNGNAVTIGPSNGNSDLFRNIHIDYDVTLPSSTTLKATTGSGTLQIANVNMIVYAQTGSGDVQLSDVGSAQHVGTGSGSIRANGVHGGATLDTGSGDIELSQQAAGDVKAQTGSGSIRLHGVNGAVRAGTGSGDIEIDGNPASDWRVSTSSGSVRLGVNPSAHFTVNASTASGSIHVSQQIKLEDSLDHQHIAGTVNGGGPTLRITTSSGDITIR